MGSAPGGSNQTSLCSTPTAQADQRADRHKAIGRAVMAGGCCQANATACRVEDPWKARQRRSSPSTGPSPPECQSGGPNARTELEGAIGAARPPPQPSAQWNSDGCCARCCVCGPARCLLLSFRSGGAVLRGQVKAQSAPAGKGLFRPCSPPSGAEAATALGCNGAPPNGPSVDARQQSTARPLGGNSLQQCHKWDVTE